MCDQLVGSRPAHTYAMLQHYDKQIRIEGNSRVRNDYKLAIKVNMICL